METGKAKMLDWENWDIIFQVYCPYIHTAKSLFKWKMFLNVHDGSYLYILLQNTQPELWTKRLPTELQIWAWGWSTELRLCICWEGDNKNIHFLQSKYCVIFQTVPQSHMKNVQELIQEFLLSQDLRFECIFWIHSVIKWGQFASSFCF